MGKLINELIDEAKQQGFLEGLEIGRAEGQREQFVKDVEWLIELGFIEHSLYCWRTKIPDGCDPDCPTCARMKSTMLKMGRCKTCDLIAYALAVKATLGGE